MKTYKIYIEKKESFNAESLSMKREIGDYLKVDRIKNIRILYGYQISGLDENQLEQSIYKIFAEKSSDLVYCELPNNNSEYYYTIRPLLGQYDQKSDSAKTMLRLLFPDSNPNVITFKHVVFSSDISASDFSNIKKYFVNPLEYQEIDISQKLLSIPENLIEPELIIDGFANMSDSELEKIKSDSAISMSFDDFLFCRDYYKNNAKDPSLTELKILDTYWSDHCRHSTFMTILDEVKISDNKYNQPIISAEKKYLEARKLVFDGIRPNCLMDVATIQMRKLKKLGVLNNLEESDEINACSIEVSGEVDGKKEDFVIMFKNETHNHPTEVEPFGGAATCIGGGIRDPLSGRSFVYGAVRVTGASDPREAFENTLDTKLAQRRITKVAALGYSSYSNQIGLAAGHLQEYYHKGFKAKRLECGALVAYNYKKNITRENAKAGDVIVLIGGKTGRDGIGGATGSSKQQVDSSTKYSAEVQKGNPLIERNIMRLFRKPEVSKIIKKCNDFGAGGVSVAIGELADSLVINLDSVPLKYPGLNGTEIAISESQERMAVLLDAQDLDEFIKQAKIENLSATKVADVTDNNKIIMTFRDEIICDLKSDFLNSGGVRQHASVIIDNLGSPNNTKKLEFTSQESKKQELKQAFLNNLSNIKNSSRAGLPDIFDKNAGAQTVFYPLGGMFMKTPEQGLAMRLPLESGTTNLGTIMTVGYDPDLCEISPFHAAMYAVIESVLKAVTMGAKLEDIRLSFQEYFESMKSAESWGKVYSSLLGAFTAQNELNLASIGGKDSMSGTYKDIDVPPTLISFAVAPCDCTKLISRAFKNAKSNIYIISTKIHEDNTPDYGELRDNIKLFNKLVLDNKISASSVVGSGGISSCISQMCFGNMIGFTFNDDYKINLFKASYCDIIIESEFELDLEKIGVTNNTKNIIIKNINISLEEALNAWDSPLEKVFYRPDNKLAKTHEIITSTKSKNIISAIKPSISNKILATPSVLIPIFPGTSGEYTLKKSFEKAGAKVTSLVFKTSDSQKSIVELKKAISDCDIFAIPSGMSAGSEPEGAAKLIAQILNCETIKNAVNALIDRGGLVFGTGEGFKALVLSGLIEHGKIQAQSDSLSINRNASDNFYSGIVDVKVLNMALPWTTTRLNQKMPVSILDGRVCLGENDYIRYVENNQIIRVYDSTGNPFGSEYNIEAMTSPNGQVFGCMCDPSMLDNGLYTNVFDAIESQMFYDLVDFAK